jgi:transcriptional regulator
MFVRNCWRPLTPEDAYGIIERHPWALLVNNGSEGPFATNLPLLLDRSRGPHGTLVGHLARANAHAQVVTSLTTPTLAIFNGPFAYVTPTWYPNRDMPGTYYYIAVHCYGHLRLQGDEVLEAALGVLNDRMEQDVPDPWRMTEIPHSEITRRLPRILGFDLEIDRIESKFKLGQDEPRKDAMAVAAHLVESTNPSHRALADAIRRANADRPDEDPA